MRFRWGHLGYFAAWRRNSRGTIGTIAGRIPARRKDLGKALAIDPQKALRVGRIGVAGPCLLRASGGDVWLIVGGACNHRTAIGMADDCRGTF